MTDYIVGIFDSGAWEVRQRSGVGSSETTLLWTGKSASIDEAEADALQSIEDHENGKVEDAPNA